MLYTLSKINLFKMKRFLFQGTRIKFLFNFTSSSSKDVNWMRGQRSSKSLILVWNITNKHKKYTPIFLTSIKLCDLWSLIQFTIFEAETCKNWRYPCKYSSEEESIYFKRCVLEYILNLFYVKYAKVNSNIFNYMYSLTLADDYHDRQKSDRYNN